MAARAPWVAAVSLLLAACPQASMHQSAETLDEGEFQAGAGFEMTQIESELSGSGFIDLGEDPFPMAYALFRWGVAEHIDLGLRASATLTTTFDAKLQLADTEEVDIAVAPAVQFAWAWTIGYLPVLIGFHLGDVAELVLSGRVGYQLFVDDFESEIEDELGDDGAILGAGFAVYVRLDERLAIVPEMTLLEVLRSERVRTIAGGIAVVFGDQPDHGSGDEE